MGLLVFDVGLFVLFSVLAVLQFATGRGTQVSPLIRLGGVLSLTAAVIALAIVVDQPPIDHLLPSGISVGLIVLGFLIFVFGIWAPTLRRREPQ